MLKIYFTFIDIYIRFHEQQQQQQQQQQKD